MASNLRQRPALGQNATIGTFYNANKDEFVPLSAFKASMLRSIIKTENARNASTGLTFDTSNESKLSGLNLDLELGSSIFAGLVTPRGSYRYLDVENDNLNQKKGLEATIYHKVTTIREEINTMTIIPESLAIDNILDSEFTHVVTGIEWGVQSVVAITLSSVLADPNVEVAFKAEVEALSSSITAKRWQPFGAPNTDIDILAYSDIYDEQGVWQADLKTTYNFLMHMIPKRINHFDGGIGRPIAYTLMPVQLFAMFFPMVQVLSPSMSSVLYEGHLRDVIKMHDQLSKSLGILSHYRSILGQYKPYANWDEFRFVDEYLASVQKHQNMLRWDFATLLRKIKSGSAYSFMVRDVLKNNVYEALLPESMSKAIEGYKEKLIFIGKAVEMGAIYAGPRTPPLQSVLQRESQYDCYVISVSEDAIRDSKLWEQNRDVFMKLLKGHCKGAPRKRNAMIIMDCSALKVNLEKVKITRYHRQKVETDDFADDVQPHSDKCVARCAKEKFTRPDPGQTLQRPLKRRMVKITCPAKCCDGLDEIHEWTCPVCLAPLEYGYTDQFIYCDCGKGNFGDFTFRCNHGSHKIGYALPHSETALYESLMKLETTGNINILILGESGVGKSTFINAFVNYMAFETLDEAKSTDKLNWVIPCAFSFQTMDKTYLDSQIKQIEVKVGKSDDERDGSTGQSATLKTQVYPVHIGTSTVRLTDTPGILDTACIGQDEKNIADIIQTLRSYDELHGILIFTEVEQFQAKHHVPLGLRNWLEGFMDLGILGRI